MQYKTKVLLNYLVYEMINESTIPATNPLDKSNRIVKYYNNLDYIMNHDEEITKEENDAFFQYIIKTELQHEKHTLDELMNIPNKINK